MAWNVHVGILTSAALIVGVLLTAAGGLRWFFCGQDARLRDTSATALVFLGSALCVLGARNAITGMPASLDMLLAGAFFVLMAAGIIADRRCKRSSQS